MRAVMIKVESSFFGKYTSRRYRIVRWRDKDSDFFAVEAIWPGGWADIGEEADTIAKARQLGDQYDLKTELERDERRAGTL